MDDQLAYLLDDLDELHAKSKIDVRHAERFRRRMVVWWPWLSREVRKLQVEAMASGAQRRRSA